MSTAKICLICENPNCPASRDFDGCYLSADLTPKWFYVDAGEKDVVCDVCGKLCVEIDRVRNKEQ